MHIYHSSNDYTFETVKKDNKQNNIYLFYFDNLHANSIILDNNVTNPYIEKIFIFSTDTKKTNTEKITYIYYESKPLLFMVFEYIEKQQLEGYILLSKPDIYFTDALKILHNTDIPSKKTIFPLNCYGMNGGIMPSTDVIIYHSTHNISDTKQKKIFNESLTSEICFYKFLYLYYILGFEMYNIPKKLVAIKKNNPAFKKGKGIKSFIHNMRRRANKDIQSPFLYLEPHNYPTFFINEFTPLKNKYNIINDNHTLTTAVKKLIDSKNNFIIPRIAGVENNLVCNMYTKTLDFNNPEIKNWTTMMVNVLKNNAGISITSMESLKKYCNYYLKAFGKCSLYSDWSPLGVVGKGIHESQDFINQRFNKNTVWAFTYDIYHNIFSNPWTHALKGKRILIISAFVDSYKQKYDDGVLSKIYGVDLFPECELVFLKPPQTQGKNNSMDWSIELERFTQKIEEIKDTFDIALCSCGGYGNPLLSNIYDMGKSAIYVGGVLQMYFGVLGQRWLRERPDIVRLFMNEHWTRPHNSEKPKGFENVEGSCYW